MSYLLAQILVCLLIAGLIGAIIGWLLRGGCKNKLRELSDKWSTRYDTEKAIWQGKIDSAEAHVEKSVELNDSEWDMRLRDLESTWENKVQALVENYDREREALEEELRIAKESSSDENSWASRGQGALAGFAASTIAGSDDNEEIEALKAELRSVKEEAESAKEKLAHADSKLRRVESDFDRVSTNDEEIEALKAELEATKLELERSNDEWSIKLQERESTWESEVQALKADVDSNDDSLLQEIAALKAELETTKLELKESDEKWSQKLKEAESDWVSKGEGALAGVAASTMMNSGDSEELEELRAKLQEAQEEAEKAKAELERSNGEWSVKLQERESDWEGKLQAIKSDYEVKVGSNDEELQSLRDELEATKKKVQDSELKLNEIESAYEEKLTVAQAETKVAKDELAKVDNQWQTKLQERESDWEGKLQAAVGDYDMKLNKIDQDRAKLEADLKAAKAKADEAESKLIADDAELFGAVGYLEECYEVEAIEGIGAGFGKKFRSMGIETTCEFADRFLGDAKAVQKAAKETNIDADAISAWASMADLMRLPGVDGQYAEIMQVVGVDSRDELTKTDAKILHEKMKEYNSKNPIVPDVPGLGLVMKWTKAPDNSKIIKALSSIPVDTTKSYELVEIEGIGPAYARKLNALGINTTAELADAYLGNDDEANRAAQQMGIDSSALKSWAKMADILRLPGVDGQYAEILQAVGVSSKDDIKSFDPKYLYDKMVEFNSKNPIVPEVPSLELLAELTGKSIDKIDEKDSSNSSSDSDIDSDDAHLNECYDIEEVEGIGPGYGKRLRNMGILTTCDLADRCLIDNGATKKVSKKIGVDFDAVRAWASMADLMRLPGVDGQYAEIMQTVGVGSRKELIQLSINSLHKDMEEFNSKKPIVPEVPTMEMLKDWVVAAKKH
jgi:predicted flap endonuclease-1-like 5' DNA nuclease